MKQIGMYGEVKNARIVVFTVRGFREGAKDAIPERSAPIIKIIG